MITRPFSIHRLQQVQKSSTVDSDSHKLPQPANIKLKNDFKLSVNFLAKYKNAIPPFGFNGLGELVYRRTYSRLKTNGEREQWWETVERVVNGTYNIQKKWIEQNDLGWDAYKAQMSAQRMYDRIFNMKFLPPGRGLWAMGSPLTEERGIFAALNNCAFVSTESMWDGRNAPSRPFTFLMDATMLGVGVGFDTKGATIAEERGKVVTEPNVSKGSLVYTIPDSREGWVRSVELLIDSYFDPKMSSPEFNYDQIRPAGLPIKGFGGVSSGPGPLKDLHDHIRATLNKNVGAPLTVTSIVDLMNLIGKCIVSGNVRRTAEIAFGDPMDDEYIDLKNYEVNPHRSEYGWTSNNSVFAQLGMDYTKVCSRVIKNGEPGFAWLENARSYGRMSEPMNMKDARAMGGNPCLEQTLESFELCCLVEVFPSNHNSLEDFLETLESAFLYAKTVTLGNTHWKESNQVMLRNRRIGTGLSGIAQFISKRGLHEFKNWCEEGYKAVQQIDKQVSEWFCIPRSIKTTTVKPSGTVSLLAGATPGMHYPESRYCIRRVRIAKGSEMISALNKAGYKIEQDVVEPNSVVVEIPIDHGDGLRGLKEVSMWEQLSLAAFMQKYWSDNQVSCTVTLDPTLEGPHLKHALDYFQYQLKGVSFLPRLPLGAYPQMPYEAIDEETYYELTSRISNPTPHSPKPPRTHQKLLKRLVADGGVQIPKPDFRHVKEEATDPEMERYCDSSSCVIESSPRITSKPEQ
ncbi:putative adenosylcobalamin-dependent ribonucleoside-triphosphate reductase [Basidiobolus meristosporus CBS 931.73]|uniref:ribonucleoside-triphosphate reductase (thioredoxin) n=1 Tax=Basidiobolus meristosporus CBS 931.73 TaxID=1314790 RepID=A0A1Y1XU27_9FUNG|nr:putative adenosylcobalamin-dependent ribonucleoside-triphosphate reductase [Basidiobolus meristosporus CBS 931.73]|eukprot:ORX89267.1 putative adenosylcobalamin-dependent ribonucleoside-triphosphate reductase [Basidiobolus meristosporus CBS 931.73]